MSAYAEICSMFEQRRKVEEEYASAAYSQLLTFVELFEFYIGCQQPDLVGPRQRQAHLAGGMFHGNRLWN